LANKRIIILDRADYGAGAQFQVALWAIVPAARVSFYADMQANFVSAWKGISGAETANFTSGLWTETVISYTRSDSTPIAAVQADLQVAWQKFQTDVNAYNPWARYGTYWDDTGAWVNQQTP